MATNIVIVGGASGTAAQSAAFMDIWSAKFSTSVMKPDPWDIVGAAAGLYTGGLSSLATRGGTQEMAIATENAYRLGVDIPFGVGMGTSSMAQGGVQNGMAGFFREMAGVSFGTAAGWAGGAAATAVLGVVFSPALAVAGGIVASVGFAYVAGKEVTSGIDAFNEWMSQAPTSGQQVHTLADGASITINPDRSYAVAKGGNCYYYDTKGELTSTYIASKGMWLDINNQTGVINATDSTGAVLSTQMQVDVDGNLALSDPSNSSELGTLSQNAGGYVISSQGNQTVVPLAQPGQDPIVYQLNGDGSNTTTTYNELTKQTTIEWSAPNVGSGTQVMELNGSYQGTWSNTDGSAGSVTFDTATQQLNMSWVNPDHTVGTVVSNASGAVTTIRDANGNVLRENWESNPNFPPTGAQTLFNAIDKYGGTVIDALTLIKAIQTGEPLPVLTSGLRLINDINALNGGTPNYSLSGAASVGSSILSVMSLNDALKRGDTLGAITAGAQALGAGVQAYISFAGGAANVSSSVNNLSTTLNGTPNVPGPSVIGVLNLVNAIANDDPVGAAMATISMTPAAPIAYAYYAFQLVTSIFSDNTPPEAWGTANATWSGFNAVVNATGAYGGLETATQTYNGVLSYLDQLAAKEQTLNPGSPIGIVANRLPSLSYRNYTGYSITDIDPLTGEQRNPGVLYDLTGRPYNAPAGSVQASQSLNERMIRVALERGAIAPLWEVETAALQTQAGDPMAGLTEEERAGRAGKLAPALAADAASQTFRPVTLDLNGDGVQTTGAARTAAFNVDDSGYLKNTAWLSNGDGFLFLDRNLNGQIDGGKELFSNAAVALSERGLAGMRWIDSNYDGSLSALDPVWNELKVWQDANGNGTSDAGETKTLAQLGITSLNYAMGTFERNGQLSELSSPDLIADTQGTITYTVPEGIIIQTSNGQVSLLATRIDDRSAIQANRDGVTGYEDTELIISAADLLANDTLAGFSGANLSITNVSGFTHGSGFLDGNGFVHYTPDANYFGAANDGNYFCERRAA